MKTDIYSSFGLTTASSFEVDDTVANPIFSRPEDSEATTSGKRLSRPWSDCRESRPLPLLREFILNCLEPLLNASPLHHWVFWIVFSNNVKVDILGEGHLTDMYY